MILPEIKEYLDIVCGLRLDLVENYIFFFFWVASEINSGVTCVPLC